ncbi:hypothetical protein [Arthrobacter sp. SDTb3-6]|uniref:hypothetical protein n=1 Tax=Arthrobacter sp. SDTb3-6 TaxID=2713571 RepID=UPI00159E809D|nr:hypothetical protein [Arthrobacter sp. SDTb3-6]NVM97683.1 hypothetical protein [Arthrobacter sp. SDTb3-6]
MNNTQAREPGIIRRPLVGKFDSMELVAFGPVENPAASGLPAEDAGMVLVALMDNSDGQKVTFLVSADDALILGHGAIGLGGGFAASGSYFRKARPGWWPEWETPADPSAWLTPSADQ